MIRYYVDKILLRSKPTYLISPHLEGCAFNVQNVEGHYVSNCQGCSVHISVDKACTYEKREWS